MFKLLVLCCVLVGGVLAEPVPFQKELGEHRAPSCRGQKPAGEQACAGARGQLVAHPADCRLFFYCTRVGPVCHRCPFRLHFNPSLRVCDWPQNAGCTANSHSSPKPSPPSKPSGPPAPPSSPSGLPAPPSSPSGLPAPPSSPSGPPAAPPSSLPPSNSESPSSEPPAASEQPSTSPDAPASSEPALGGSY